MTPSKEVTREAQVQLDRVYQITSSRLPKDHYTVWRRSNGKVEMWNVGFEPSDGELLARGSYLAMRAATRVLRRPEK